MNSIKKDSLYGFIILVAVFLSLSAFARQGDLNRQDRIKLEKIAKAKPVKIETVSEEMTAEEKIELEKKRNPSNVSE